MSRPELSAQFAVERDRFRVEVDLNVVPGRPVALVGPNGAGKSTILAAIAGLVPLRSGGIRIGGRILDDVPGVLAIPAEDRRVGVVFQDFVLFPHMTVRDNVAFASRVRTGVRRSREQTAVWLDRYALADLADRYPRELSGGQAQRVALARALAAEPEVLLLDEPMAALDVETRDEMRTELAAHVRDFGGATVLVSHSLADVTALAVEVVVLEHGRITQRGSVDDLRAAPATPYIARLTASVGED